jgi:predicted enzyme related to lactoylglutathione lyase
VNLRDNFRKVAFTMYPAENLERARHFYEKILNLQHGAVSAEGRWIEYDLPQGGCLCITDLVPEIKPSATAGGTLAFEVSDLDAVVQELKARDVRFKTEVFHSPVCRMAVILDSEGNSIMLHQLK